MQACGDYVFVERTTEDCRSGNGRENGMLQEEWIRKRRALRDDRYVLLTLTHQGRAQV